MTSPRELNLFDEDFPRLSETASPHRCKRCMSMVWKVIERGGFTVYLDPEKLSPADELKVYLERRHTFRVWRTGNGFEVDFRTDWDIQHDDGSRIILVEHNCDLSKTNTELPDYWPHRFTNTQHEECPF